MSVLHEAACFDPSGAKLISRFRALRVFFWYRLPSSRREKAADLAQECLVAWVGALRRGVAIADEDSFLFAVARKKLADEIRRGKRSLEVPLEEHQEACDVRLASRASSESLREDHAREAALAEAIDGLTRIESRMLYLRYVDRLTNDEASRRLGISPPCGSRIRHRAIGKLRERVRRVLEERHRAWNERRDRHGHLALHRAAARTSARERGSTTM